MRHKGSFKVHMLRKGNKICALILSYLENLHFRPNVRFSFSSNWIKLGTKYIQKLPIIIKLLFEIDFKSVWEIAITASIAKG